MVSLRAVSVCMGLSGKCRFRNQMFRGSVLLCFFVFAFALLGIRVMLLVRKRRPCAGRHLLFFAAAKKSRQKKAAHTASTCFYPRAP
ncbi:hypothetical protein, partial [Paraburkholderia caribensis]|uniref:hypothetical protein n=1 Tax=Paraburkholderia caribensis TaxID=75105 RepID=UPI001CC73C90